MRLFLKERIAVREQKPLPSEKPHSCTWKEKNLQVGFFFPGARIWLFLKLCCLFVSLSVASLMFHLANSQISVCKGKHWMSLLISVTAARTPFFGKRNRFPGCYDNRACDSFNVISGLQYHWVTLQAVTYIKFILPTVRPLANDIWKQLWINFI